MASTCACFSPLDKVIFSRHSNTWRSGYSFTRHNRYHVTLKWPMRAHVVWEKNPHLSIAIGLWFGVMRIQCRKKESNFATSSPASFSLAINFVEIVLIAWVIKNNYTLNFDQSKVQFVIMSNSHFTHSNLNSSVVFSFFFAKSITFHEIQKSHPSSLVWTK